MARKKPDYDLLSYGVDLSQRVLWLGSVDASKESGVDAALAAHTINSLYLLNKAAPDGDKPIDIMMHNPGGCEFACAAIYDAIAGSINPVTISVYGMAMSAASILMQAAPRRLIAPSATLMLHYGSWGYHDHPKVMYNWAEQGKKMDAWMESVYLTRIRQKHPKYKLKDLQRLLDFDTFFDAQEAVNIGLADEII